MRRIPGTTPATHARLAGTLAAIPGLRGNVAHIDPEAILAQVTEAFLAALPTAPSSGSVSVVVRRSQALADDLRGKGMAGVARDVDLMAGALLALSLELQALMASRDVPHAVGMAPADARATGHGGIRSCRMSGRPTVSQANGSACR